MSIYIGCSWYYYPSWKWKFYPTWLASKDWLPYYAEHFNTVEINSSFYKIPTIKSLQKNYQLAPQEFTFTLKAPKQFTHIQKMNDVKDWISDFYDIVHQWLSDKIAHILFQFPPSFHYSHENLNKILSQINSTLIKTVIEFRHESWMNQEVITVLDQHNFIYCNVSYPWIEDHFMPNHKNMYLRLHGKPILFKSWYWIEWLQPRINHIKQNDASDTYIYCNNTWYGEAINDCRLLQNQLTIH